MFFNILGRFTELYYMVLLYIHKCKLYANNCIKTVATFCFVALWKSLNYFTLYVFIELLQMNNKVAKFDKFIKDNDAKRRRAIQKYQIEVLLKEQKQTEYEQLCEQLAALKKRSASQIRVELNV